LLKTCIITVDLSNRDLQALEKAAKKRSKRLLRQQQKGLKAIDMQLLHGQKQEQAAIHEKPSNVGNPREAIQELPTEEALHSVDDLKECVICMERPREAGFVHAGTMHMVVCRKCVGLVEVGDPCPMCRVPVEHVVSAIF
jgi:hypothetical protein